MSSIVEYILSLKSNQFEAGIASADRSTNALEHSMGSLKNSVLGFVGAFASFEFLSTSVSMFNESAQASAQLDASLKSTANAANLNREALNAQSEALMNKSLYDDDAITSSQALLATFTQVKNKIYMEAIPAIVDMSTKMGGDLQGATIQVGKALNNPIQGISALARVGVTFSESQKTTIKTMVETNDVASAQALILAELTKEFGGSAEAASLAGTGPFTVLKNQFGNVREEIGALVVAIGRDLKPEIEGLIRGIGTVVKWLVEHKSQVESTGKALLVYAGVVRVVIPLMQTLALTVGGAGTATAAFGAASTAALGPIGLVALALGGLVYAYNEVSNAAANAQNAMNKKSSEAVNSEKSRLDELVKTYESWGYSKEKATKAVYETSKKEANQTALDLAKEYEFQKYNKSRDEDAFKILTNDLIRSADKETAIEEWHKGQTKKENKYMPPPSVQAPASSKLALPAASKSQAKPIPSNLTNSQGMGSKSITFNIQINDLVKNFTVNATTIRESAKIIHDLVTGALTGAVNDFQRAIPE